VKIFKDDFIDFLRYFRLNPDHIDVRWNDETKEVEIPIKGSWLNTILFEVPVLAIFSETFGRDIQIDIKYIEERIFEKVHIIERFNLEETQNKKPFLKFADFGTRRRYGYGVQDLMIRTFKTWVPDNFIGTSNVHFAMKYRLKPIGTMAHEFFQVCQQLTRLEDSQKFALQKWADEYRGSLGIALSDTVGFDAFLRDFDLYFAKLFDGCRQDSGNPFVWGEKMIAHYEKLGIDPKTKQAVFSDGLYIPKAVKIHRMFADRINVAFGIGTDLTNDCGFKAPQIVIKVVSCNGKPTAKISDSPGKAMCRDKEYVKYLKKVFRID